MHTRTIFARHVRPGSCGPGGGRLAARLGDVEQVLAGSLAEQSRRCGRPGCRCADGEPHGPYAYFTPRPAGRGRARYVPAALAGRGAPLPAARRGGRGGAGGDLGDQRRAAGPQGTAVAGGRRRPDRARAGRGGGGAGQHDDLRAGRQAVNGEHKITEQAPGSGRRWSTCASRLDGRRSASTPSRRGGSTPWPDTAVALGWAPQGRRGDRHGTWASPGSGAAHREGFTRTDVAGLPAARSGRCFGLEISRLARSNADVARLAEMARMTGTLLIDSDGVYDLVGRQRLAGAGLEGHDGSQVELHMMARQAAGGQAGRRRARRAAHPAAGRAGLRRRRRWS